MRALRRLLAGVCAALLFAGGQPAAAERATGPGAALPPPAVAAAAELGGALAPLGQGEMRWFGFTLYDAALWAPPGGWAADGVFALSIQYRRPIAAERLVAASIDELRRLGYDDEARLAQWEKALAAALPSVAAGDTLTGVHLPGRGAQFWHGERATATIADAELARAFFAIWLDPRTREPALRARLLGMR